MSYFKYKKLNNHYLEYALPNIEIHYRKSGTFIAVKLIEHFILNVLRGNKLIFSNQYLSGKFYCTVSGLQDAYKVLEKDGIVSRTFNDENRHDRSEFIIDMEKAIEWLSVTTYDDEYKAAPKRSLFKAFVNQSVLFIKNKAKAIRNELNQLKNKNNAKIRKEKIESLNQKLDNKYDRYMLHLKTRLEKLEARKEKRSMTELIREANYAIRELVMGWGFNPPDLNSN